MINIFTRYNVWFLIILTIFQSSILTVQAAHFHISNVVIRSGSTAHHGSVTSLQELIGKLRFDKQMFEKENLVKCAESFKQMSSRTPLALKETIFSSADSFFNSLLAIIPIGLIYNIKQIRTVKLWLKNGVMTGLEWGKVTAIYAGGETFCKAIRGVDDRQNAYLGSGLASAVLRIQDGPIGMLQGFAIGYVFLIAVDSVLKHTDASVPLPVIEKHGKHELSLAQVLFNHKSPVIKSPKVKLPKVVPPKLPARATRIVSTVTKIKH
mmetsp:Transcript_31600/g.34545  ORF Transcript_31600/g.34545 Transcript_31600/m.34545 type:complete len:266 (+) Transcript_31600:242-1039(+)|eukprot:gene2226-2368_t